MKVKLEIDSKTVTTHAEIAELLRHTAERILAAWGPGKNHTASIGGKILDVYENAVGKWSVSQ